MPLEKTITFDHRFFDDVFRKLGWEKVPRLQGNTPGGETVDYIGDGYALELKHLSTNSYLEADSKAENRKRRLLEFQTVQYLAGNLVVDWINNVAGPSPGKQNAFNRQLFEWHFGNSLRNAMTTADGQIASTRTLRPSAHLRGAVFVVNNALPILDTNDLAQLMVMYLSELEGAGDAYTKRRLPNTDVAFGLCAALEEADIPSILAEPKAASAQGIGIQALVCAGPSPISAEDDALLQKLTAAITVEVQARFFPNSAPLITTELQTAAIRRRRRTQSVNLNSKPMTITVGADAAELEPGFAAILKRTWTRAKAFSDEKKGHETKKCHYTPRSFLARWAGPDGMLQIQDVKTGGTASADPRDVATSEDLYTLLLPDGTQERRFTEKFFQIVEEAMVNCLKEPFLFPAGGADIPKFVPKARQVMALFAAVQIIRLPTVLDRLSGEWKKDWNPEWGVIADGSPHRGNLLRRLLGGAEPFEVYGKWFASMVQTLSEKRWTCLVYATPSNLQHIRFQTGDIPLRFAVRGDRSISNDPKDWAIQMPLGADCLLALDEVTPAGELLSEGLHCIDPSKPMGIWDAPGLTVRIL